MLAKVAEDLLDLAVRPMGLEDDLSFRRGFSLVAIARNTSLYCSLQGHCWTASATASLSRLTAGDELPHPSALVRAAGHLKFVCKANRRYTAAHRVSLAAGGEVFDRLERGLLSLGGVFGAGSRHLLGTSGRFVRNVGFVVAIVGLLVVCEFGAAVSRWNRIGPRLSRRRVCIVWLVARSSCLRALSRFITFDYNHLLPLALRRLVCWPDPPGAK